MVSGNSSREKKYGLCGICGESVNDVGI